MRNEVKSSVSSAVPGSSVKSCSGSKWRPIAASTSIAFRQSTSGPTVTTTLLSETWPVPRSPKAAFIASFS